MQQQATRKPMVRRGASRDVVNVESQSVRGVFYSVHVPSGRCSCPAGKRGRLCWHVPTAQAYWAMRTAMVATVPPQKPRGMAALQEAFG